jgi:hypothetical protein
MALQLSQAAVSQTRTTTPNHFLTTHEAEIKAMSQRMVGASLASEAYTGTGLRALPFEYCPQPANGGDKRQRGHVVLQATLTVSGTRQKFSLEGLTHMVSLPVLTKFLSECNEIHNYRVA